VGEKLCKAAARGDLAALRKYIDAEGASVNACDYDQRSALHLAAAEGHESAVSFLLDARADVNAQDRWGGTPLKDAERGWYVSVMKLLQRRGGTKPGSGSSLITGTSTPDLIETELGEMLCHAAAVGDIRTIQGLVSQGASVNFCDYDRRSALHLVSSLAKAGGAGLCVLCAGMLVSCVCGGTGLLMAHSNPERVTAC
jgi:glutaminase